MLSLAVDSMSESLMTMAEVLVNPSTGVPVMMAAWATLYQVFTRLPVFQDKTFGFTSRAVAIVHAFMAVGMVIPLILFDQGLIVGGPNTKPQLLVLCMTAGFFAFDVISWFWNGIHRNKMDWGQIFHHTAVLTSISFTYRLGHSATDCVLGLFIAEVANPFLYMRYILWYLGLEHAPIGKLNQRIFMVILSLTVPLAAPILAYHIIKCPHNSLFHKVSVAGLILVNLYWYVIFCQKWAKELFPKKAAKEVLRPATPTATATGHITKQSHAPLLSRRKSSKSVSFNDTM